MDGKSSEIENVLHVSNLDSSLGLVVSHRPSSRLRFTSALRRENLNGKLTLPRPLRKVGRINYHGACRGCRTPVDRDAGNSDEVGSVSRDLVLTYFSGKANGRLRTIFIDSIALQT
jgi:hypothetical protein